ncbi:hypothetical protein G6F57_019319 [Rhizopus arrhizus]|nr:hypothetical protein G6F57_019319 [Rhizopus arrhizus]
MGQAPIPRNRRTVCRQASRAAHDARPVDYPARRVHHRARQQCRAVHLHGACAEPRAVAPGARPAAGQCSAPDPRVRGLHPPVARQYEAGLQGQGVLLALRFRDLARRRRHALDARAQLLGAVDRQQRVQRPADAGARNR